MCSAVGFLCHWCRPTALCVCGHIRHWKNSRQGDSGQGVGEVRFPPRYILQFSLILIAKFGPNCSVLASMYTVVGLGGGGGGYDDEIYAGLSLKLMVVLDNAGGWKRA